MWFNIENLNGPFAWCEAVHSPVAGYNAWAELGGSSAYGVYERVLMKRFQINGSAPLISQLSVSQVPLLVSFVSYNRSKLLREDGG